MLYAVVMAGGVGERFWPLSTPQRPKQLVPFLGDRPLLVKAIERLDPLLPMERIVVVTSRALADPVRALLPALPHENLLLEPVGKNTAPAAALATLMVSMRDPDSVIAMFPSDHFIDGKVAFQEQLRHASRVTDLNYIVTFGIRPHYPATGYGYVRVGDPIAGLEGEKACRAQAFVEKPDPETARKYMDDGGYLWNSGIFVWSGKSFLEEVAVHAPALDRSLLDVRDRLGTPDESAALEQFYGEVESISVDYAIMERSKRIAVIPAAFRWDDLGSWPALERICEADAAGNVIVGKSILSEVENSIVYSDDGVVALLGVRDLVVVRVGGVTMVCPRARAEEVKTLAREWKRGSGRR